MADATAPTIDLNEETVAEAVELLAAVPSPPGAERAAAERIASWGAARAPELGWSVEPLPGGGANLVAATDQARTSPAVVLYCHLDTSLSAIASEDAAIVGDGRTRDLVVDRDRGVVHGPGAAVAKGPAGAALVAFLSAVGTAAGAAHGHGLVLLLAGGGTHRSTPPVARHRSLAGRTAGFGTGVRAYLGDHRHEVAAVVNAKAGPGGVVHAEPGSLYLHVEIRGAWGHALTAATLEPQGGVLRVLGAALLATEAWAAELEHADDEHGETARVVSVGAVRAGMAEKPDLLPGVLDLFVYVATIAGDTGAAVAEDLRGALVDALPSTVDATVTPYAETPASRTDPSSPVVLAAHRAWARHHGGQSGPQHRWRGSTDGGLFAAAGIDVVRMGAAPEPTDDDGHERISLRMLTAAASAQAEVLVELVGVGGAHR